MENHFSIPKSPLVKDSIVAFWQTHRPNDPAVKETIIPKGVVEFIFSFETPQILARINSQNVNLPRCFVRGFYTIPIQLHLSGWQTYFGVVLNAAATRHILKIQPVEFFNSCIAFSRSPMLNKRNPGYNWQSLVDLLSKVQGAISSCILRIAGLGDDAAVIGLAELFWVSIVIYDVN